MKDEESNFSWTTNFKWTLGIAVSVVGILVSVLIFMVSNLATKDDVKAVREEIVESRKYAVQYTDKMVELLLKTNEKKK